ncbi:MAG: hypothetical protein H6Q73_2449 [Firmicutes bacterium]|nr:hypothetical protein [Bacillota bacterium]
MKKTILALVAGSMMVSSVGFAAPITNMWTGEAAVGYNYYSLSHSTDNSSVYLQGDVSDKFTLGIERNNNSTCDYDDWNTTDIYAHYKLNPNFRIIVGDRDYDYGNVSNKVFYGVGYTTKLAPRMDGYASIIGNSYTTEWQAGVNYALDRNVSLNVGYKSTKDDGYATYDGLGVGVNYKF